MIYDMPTVYSGREGFERLAALAKAAEGLFSDRLEINFSRCSFFDANLTATLGAILTRIADDFNTVEIVDIPGAIAAILRKNQFLEAYGYSRLEDRNHTTLPYRRLRPSDAGRFEIYLNRHLQGKGIPQMTEGLGKAFRDSIFEVFQNAVIHSESRLGIFVCGQFYPQAQRLDITIADAGVGIRTNVRHYLGDKRLSSVDAIRWALQSGNTTKTGSQPGGIGLKVLQEFIRLNQGKIHIASRRGLYEYSGGRESFVQLAVDLPGTTVNLEVNTADTASYCLYSDLSPDEIF